MQIPHQARESAHHIPQQRGIGRVVNVGFHHCGIDAELLAVFQPQLDGSLHYGLIQGLHRRRRQAQEGAVEGVVQGNLVAVKQGKTAQSIAVVDALAQFAIIPVLDAHQQQGAEGLLGTDPAASHGGVLQTPLQIAAHQFDQRRTVVEEVHDAAQGGIELQAERAQFQVGEAELGFQGAAHDSFPFFGRRRWWFNSQIRSKAALSWR